VRDLNQTIFNILRAYFPLPQEDVVILHPPKTDNYQDHFISPSVDSGATVRSSFYTPTGAASSSNLSNSGYSDLEPPPPPPVDDVDTNNDSTGMT
jgi:hypothetical protein